MYLVAIFFALIFSCSVNAGVTNTIVNINGAITGASCTINVSSDVDFGAISARDIMTRNIEKSINFTRSCDWTESNTNIRIIPTMGIVSGQTNAGKSIMRSGLNGIAIGIMKMGLYGAMNFNEDYAYHEKIIDLKFKLFPIAAEQMIAGKIDTSIILRLTYD